TLGEPTALTAANAEAAQGEVDAKLPPANAGAVPPVNGYITPLPPAAEGAPCMSGPRHRSCWEQLDDWLTYRPLSRDCHDCFLKPAPCCEPPLYAFFIGGCCVTPAPANRGACGVGCGHRLAGFWEGLRSCCQAPAQGECRIWLNLSNVRLWPCKSCAHPDDVIVEK